MKKAQGARGSESRHAYSALANKSIDGNQTLTDGIDREEKTFKSHGTEQRWTVGGYEALSRYFIAVQCQPRFGYRPYISLPASDHDALRARRLEFKPFRQRAGHHGKSGASVHKKLNFFDKSRRTGQMRFDVEQSHFKYLFKNMTHCNSDKRPLFTNLDTRHELFATWRSLYQLRRLIKSFHFRVAKRRRLGQSEMGMRGDRVIR